MDFTKTSNCKPYVQHNETPQQQPRRGNVLREQKQCEPTSKEESCFAVLPGPSAAYHRPASRAMPRRRKAAESALKALLPTNRNKFVEHQAPGPTSRRRSSELRRTAAHWQRPVVRSGHMRTPTRRKQLGPDKRDASHKGHVTALSRKPICVTERLPLISCS